MRFLVLALSMCLACPAQAEDSIVTRLQQNGPAPILEWHAQINLPMAGMAPEYQIEWSSDLATWQPLDTPIPGGVGVGDEILRRVVSGLPANAFYRVRATVNIASGGDQAASMYGYATEFSRKLQTLGQIPLQDFVTMYSPTNEYRSQISFDPTTALFWNDFNTDPAVYNATNTTNDKRLADFRFTPEEFAIFKTNGFVVSPRLGSHSFADAFYKVYIDDLPVYVSSDALLHAWHRTYASILLEVEGSFLQARFASLLTAMRTQIPALHRETAGTPMENGVRDADYYLAVARSLLGGTTDAGTLNQGDRVNATLSAIQSLTAQEDFPLFGAVRYVDFSQFKPRGHYAGNPVLEKYFRAMIWAGIVDFQFGANKPQHLREFSGAVALTMLMDRSNSKQKWIEYDQTVRAFVGLPDCMTYIQLSDLLAAAEFAAPFNKLEQVYEQIRTGALGTQQIKSGYYYSPLSAKQYKMPRSFALMPQRFVIDSWAFTKVVFDDIIWDENGIPEIQDKIQRRVPSALDVAFSVFGNDHTVPEIAARISNTSGRQWRDGLPYQHNLAAARQCVDDHEAAYWGDNMYTAWLGCLRELSTPTADANFPQAFQTWAWAMSSLNTQLASWTQLRHDTILYAKQSSTGMIMCGYPDAYVEPRPDFWRRFGAMMTRARTLLAGLPEEGSFYSTASAADYSTANLKTNWVEYVDRFVAAAGMLEGISTKQLAHGVLDEAEADFLQNIVEQQATYVTRGGRTYTGWYPALFYKPLGYRLPYGLGEGADAFDALVTDVHMDAKDTYGSGDPGCILHQAVGSVNMAFFAIDCGTDQPIMYAGPVMSHYEFEQPIDKRLTDAEWKTILKNGQQPAPPTWTKSFLVPGAPTLGPEVFW